MSESYVIVGEFDDDEIVESLIIGVAEKNSVAETIAQKANDLIEKIRKYDKDKIAVSNEWENTHKCPKTKVRIGKITNEIRDEIENEKMAYQAWDKERLAYVDANVTEPNLDEDEKYISPLITKYLPSVWEGGFYVEEVKTFQGE